MISTRWSRAVLVLLAGLTPVLLVAAPGRAASGPGGAGTAPHRHVAVDLARGKPAALPDPAAAVGATAPASASGAGTAIAAAPAEDERPGWVQVLRPIAFVALTLLILLRIVRRVRRLRSRSRDVRRRGPPRA